MLGVPKLSIILTRPPVAAIVILAACCYACSSPEQSRVKQLRELIPELPADAARHLISSDDSTLARYARDVGIRQLLNILWLFSEAVAWDTRENLERTMVVLMPPVKRLNEAIAIGYGLDHPLRYYDFFTSLPAEQAMDVKRLQWKLGRTFEDPRLSAREKIEIIKGVLEELEKVGHSSDVALGQGMIGNLLANVGDQDASLKYFQSSLAGYRAAGAGPMVCQMLGVLGSIHGGRGQIDSMTVCWEEARAIANRHRLPMQAARITSFFAAHYARQGRLSLAHDLYDEAIDRCREYKGGDYEVRYLNSAMGFHADLGAWEIVGRLLPRVRVVERNTALVPPKDRQVLRLKTDQTEARYLLALGRIEEAQAVFERIKSGFRDLPWHVEYVRFLFRWAEALMDGGHPEKALPVIREGFTLSKEVPQTQLPARFLLLLSTALYELRDIQASRQALEQFEDIASEHVTELRREWILRDVLVARIQLAEGNRAESIATAEAGLSRLERALAQMDAGAHGYLWMGECDGLRQLLQELVADDPVVGYGVELVWRDAYQLLGRKSRAASDGPTFAPRLRGGGDEPFFEHARRRGEAARANLLGWDVVHCVYSVQADSVWRWTSTQAGVRRKVLDIGVAELQEIVADVFRSMAAAPGERHAVPGRSLVTQLRRLAAILLPSIVPQETSADTSTFLVTADGFLGQIPFEALNLSATGEYVPLLRTHDVAYLRRADPAVGTYERGPGLVLINAQSVKRLRKQYIFGRLLEEVIAEGEAVAASHPDAIVLKNDAATKKRLLANWEAASFLYAATHIIRDPEVPYLTLVPLVDPGGLSGPDASYLDIGDIRMADLTRCDVVVLSGCSSGAPYVGARKVGPSLGDAFLDAGAGVVVQTFWDVPDEEARALMSEFGSGWGDSAPATIKTLNAVRRSRITGPNGARHPFWWAAYSIKVGRI